jgi:hypothetical protein
MLGMRKMCGAGSPDNSANPRNSCEDHVHDRPEHENQKSAVPIAELAKNEAENPVAQAEDEPSDKTGS